MHEERAKREALVASLAVSDALRQRLMAAPETKLYVQNLGFFDEITPLLPTDIRSRMVLLYSAEQEIHWLRHDTASLTAMHMQHFTAVPTESYEHILQQPGEHLVLLHPDGWEWLGKALPQDGARLTPLGKALGGELVSVHLPARGIPAP